MKLSTGKTAFPIEFDNGDKAVIYFNPNDKGVQERIRNFEKSIEQRVKAIDVEKYRARIDEKMNFGGDISDPDTLLKMSAEELRELQVRLDAVSELEDEYNKAIRDELDSIFDSNISDVAFKYCQPFDIVVAEADDGTVKREMYVMQFLHWLMLELKKYGEENKSAMDKHIGKYSNG